jgi:hypothetical protein
MSLTINNTLAQQQAVQAQIASTQAATAAQTNAASATSSAASSPTTDPSAALISGNAGLTSDLLSVLLQDQSGASGGSSTTFAGILDQQAGLQSGTTSASSSAPPTLAGILNQQDQLQAEQSGNSSLTSLDPALAAQSGVATGSVMSGLQDLLDQLAV